MSEPAEAPCVLVDRQDAVGIIRLNRPERRNALDLAMRRGIARACSELDADPTVRTVIITGGAGIFAAGADLNLLIDKGAQQIADIDLGQYWSPLAHCSKPTIAAVSGFALGAGCELALMCDVVVADATARFGQPEINVGIMPGAGGTQRLVRIVGKHVASLMLLTGEPLTGERAFALGLVAALAESGQVVPTALQFAERMSRMPGKAVAAIRRALRMGADLPLDAALALENREFLLLFDTADKTEGMRAFLERRRPNFAGD
ncbi:enoyl-CoA hydratase/isomerase family protein [Bradyrhizobium manausense]|uniref:enoyl-CoA hydratase-related protein n=1 Tax=Bradyrhizobium manausense TaxID=989370 RepID=UPI001BAB0E34|nr:enoyl-CoA hydratase-related protein [Bradyrhizobium manausense]MBR0687738.1 enoyl-CoA hydratase/isomerase family protein [Bradyrhizobium manausense]